jgi:hypothetical protein
VSSHPFDGAHAKGEGQETRKGQGQIEKVEHSGTPVWKPDVPVPRGRKGAIREWAEPRKVCVKGAASFAILIARGPRGRRSGADVADGVT